MNPQNYTQKTVEAVQSAQALAAQYGSPQIEQCHLLLALLEAEKGLTVQLLEKMGVTAPSFYAAVKALVERQPKVSGPGREMGKVYISPGTERTLTAAEETAKQMRDEYVSVEHLLLGLCKTAERELAELLRTYQVTEEKVLGALASVRGNQQVTSDNPDVALRTSCEILFT